MTRVLRAYADMSDAMGFGPLAEALEEDEASRALLVIAILRLKQLIRSEGGQQVLAAITAQLPNLTAAAKGLPVRDTAEAR